jgi:hypothetical protein
VSVKDPELRVAIRDVDASQDALYFDI